MLVGFILHRTDGIGLSAPQVGVNVQLMVFNPAGERGEGEEIVLINPRVNKYSQKITLFEEGCLSFPKIYGNVQVSSPYSLSRTDIQLLQFEFWKIVPLLHDGDSHALS